MSINSVTVFNGTPVDSPVLVPAPAISNYYKPSVPSFRDRLDAGHKLGERLIENYGEQLDNAVFLGCVRGGLVVAAGVVEIMKKFGYSYNLDIVVPRKLGLPSNKEYGIGSIAEDGTVIFLDETIKRFNIDLNAEEIRAQIEMEKRELLRRQTVYREGKSAVELINRTVVIVDDGMSSGATASAAVKSAQIVSKNTARIIVAMPISSRKAEGLLISQTQIPLSDICMFEYTKVPSGHIWSIDDCYEEFNDVDDETVKAIMRQ